MNALHQEYPFYDWHKNKGYPTKKHRAAIRERGTTPYHRMTFNLLGEDPQLSLDFDANTSTSPCPPSQGGSLLAKHKSYIKNHKSKSYA